MNYNEVNNYRNIKFKYIHGTNHRGARICVYESIRWGVKTKRIYLSKDSSKYDSIDEQVFDYLKDKGFNIVGKGYEKDYALFFVDNWGQNYVEVDGNKAHPYISQ
jgi:hypothetical protein